LEGMTGWGATSTADREAGTTSLARPSSSLRLPKRIGCSFSVAAGNRERHNIE